VGVILDVLAAFYNVFDSPSRSPLLNRIYFGMFLIVLFAAAAAIVSNFI
jgi:hypothetical protein